MLKQVESDGGLLGNTYGVTVRSQNVATSENNEATDTDAKFDARKARFILLASASKLWPESRIKQCFKTIIPGKQTVDIVYNLESETARITNLIRCGTAACPVCGPYDRLRKGLIWSSILGDSPYHLAMLTLTITHNRGERFSEVYMRLKAASRRMWAGRWYQWFKDEYRIIGRLSSLEVTYGENGFHPHYHIILVKQGPWLDDMVLSGYLHLARRWQDMAVQSGGFADLEHGCDLRPGNADAAKYLTKLDQSEEIKSSWGIVAEATLSDYKRGRKEGRTPMQLLSDYALKGDVHAGEIWLEIEVGLKGQTRLKASRGLYEMLGGNQRESDFVDEWGELSESDVVLLSLGQVAWTMLYKQGLIPDLYQVAKENDRQALIKFLYAHHIQLL